MTKNDKEMVQFTITVPLSMKSEILKLADIEDRTLTAQIRVLLKEALETRKENPS